ncbi:hypothetical protein H311_01725 [Anncaliia algerae PRA109]|nr:hypothetical protein H311_01725 [Anncaliia algerae PRA109]
MPKLGGDDIIVEIDKSKFCKRKYYKGHHVEGVRIFGIVECSVVRNNLFFPIKKITFCFNQYFKK